ncbi:MAG TPA: FMN-binding protein [Longimicrobiaceae bacterium]|nr:FMN-binding protein [Longimicrobiaceae bacterium]
MSPVHAAPPPAAPARAQVPAWRLVATLAAAGALAGLLIVLVFRWAQPRILEHQAQALQGAVAEVLKAPASVERYFVHGSDLLAELPSGVDSMRIDRVFLGFDEAGAPVGYAVSGGEPGFQDIIRVLFGYDPRSRALLGMRVLESKETPGLGDTIEKDSVFVAGFVGTLTPLLGVKPGAGRGEDGEVVMVTGATISSRTVIAIINHRIEALHPLLEAHVRSVGQ